jgi:hypothetical protein
MGNINPESSYDEVDEMTEKDYSQEAGFEDASQCPASPAFIE